MSHFVQKEKQALLISAYYASAHLFCFIHIHQWKQKSQNSIMFYFNKNNIIIIM